MNSFLNLATSAAGEPAYNSLSVDSRGYYNTNPDNKQATEPSQVTYEAVDDVRSGQGASYANVDQK